MNIDLQSGQTWFFEGGEDAYLQILLIEEPHSGVSICHISIQNINFPGPKGQPMTAVGHLPFDYKSVLTSVTTMRSEKEPLSDYRSGYLQWKDAFDAGKAGYFTISVAESLEVLKSAF